MALQPKLVEIRKEFRRIFPNEDLHHPFPTSRIPRIWSEERKEEIVLIVSPYEEKGHDAYHHLFSNLRIDQLWSKLAKIHNDIFFTNRGYISPWWLHGCELESGTHRQIASFHISKKGRIGKALEVRQLQSLWSRAFGGEDLITAENLLKIMMLFIVFGVELLDTDKLFENGNFQDFFEKNRSGYRLWAQEILFGKGGSVQGNRSQLVSMLNKNHFYSSKLL